MSLNIKVPFVNIKLICYNMKRYYIKITFGRL